MRQLGKEHRIETLLPDRRREVDPADAPDWMLRLSVDKPVELSTVWIKRMRAAYGLSQPRFAEALLASPDTLVRWENAVRAPGFAFFPALLAYELRLISSPPESYSVTRDSLLGQILMGSGFMSIEDGVRALQNLATAMRGEIKDE